MCVVACVEEKGEGNSNVDKASLFYDERDRGVVRGRVEQSLDFSTFFILRNGSLFVKI